MTDGTDEVDALPWLRLDRRMLLVHPVTELVRLLPVVAISLVLGTQSGNYLVGLGIAVLVVVAAIARWFTTGYRIGSDDVQLRTGVLRKKVLSIPRGRIRSVDVRAGPLHRILGLSVLTVGTGQRTTAGSETFELNALASTRVPELREILLARAESSEPLSTNPPSTNPPSTDPLSTTSGGGTAPAVPAPREREIARFRRGWVRFAPFTATGLVVVGAAAGVIAQSGLGSAVVRSSAIGSSYRAVLELGIAAAVIIGAATLLVVSTAISAARYLLVFGNLTVTDDGRRLRVGHGLVSTRHTTLDRDRLRGVSMRRPLLLRCVGGARLDAVMTGVSASENESSLLLPPAPLTAVVTTAADVLGNPHATTVLRGHGPVALRRRLTRAVGPVVGVAVALAVWQSVGRSVPAWWWLLLAVIGVAAAGLALDRYRSLGHHAQPGVLVTEHGSLDRRRVILDTDGVIAWGVRQSLVQRRAGVATVIAATAAGTGRYLVLDIPEREVWTMIESASAGAGDIWVVRA